MVHSGQAPCPPSSCLWTSAEGYFSQDSRPAALQQPVGNPTTSCEGLKQTAGAELSGYQEWFSRRRAEKAAALQLYTDGQQDVPAVHHHHHQQQQQVLAMQMDMVHMSILKDRSAAGPSSCQDPDMVPAQLGPVQLAFAQRRQQMALKQQQYDDLQQEALLRQQQQQAKQQQKQQELQQRSAVTQRQQQRPAAAHTKLKPVRPCLMKVCVAVHLMQDPKYNFMLHWCRNWSNHPEQGFVPSAIKQLARCGDRHRNRALVGLRLGEPECDSSEDILPFFSTLP